MTELRTTRWLARWFVCVVFAVRIGLAATNARAANQPYVVRHWGIDDGLPPGPGGALLQSRDGHIWLGTEEGMARFNGTDFTVFDSFNTPEMKSNQIFVLFEDRDGNMWIGNGSEGLLRLTDGVFKRFGPESGLKNGSISAIQQDTEGTLWVGTDGGGLYRLEGETFQPVTFSEPANSPFVVSIACTPDNAIWVAYKNGVRRIDHDGNEFFGTNVFTTASIYSVCSDTEGKVWVGGVGMLAEQMNGSFIRHHWEQSWGDAMMIKSGPGGGLWIGTSHGVLHLEGDNGKLFTTADGLAGNMINELMVDREGSVWVIENGSGIDQMKPSRFETLGTAQGLSHPTVTSIMEDSAGGMWLATEDGLNHFADGTNMIYRTDQGLSWNMIFTVAEDHDGAIWAGGWRGLNRLENGAITIFNKSPDYPSWTTWCSYRDADGTLYFGTPSGLISRTGDRFHTWNHQNSGLSHDDVRCVLRDHKGRLWVGTSYGLNRLEGAHFVNYYDAGPDQSMNVVLALHEDLEGGIWIGTQGKGLFLFKDDHLTRLTTADGLYDNLIFTILEDDDGYLWLTSNRGLFRVSRQELEDVALGKTKRVVGRVFTKADGLPTPEFNGTVQPVGWKCRDGRLWFASTAGAVIVSPENLFTNKVPPAVSIETVELDGKTLVHQHRETLVVPPGTERIAFKYAVLSYISPGALRSRYRLEGFDKTWQTNAAMHEAQYTRLKPGTYRFQVAAANGDGVWNETGTSLGIIVQPFFWEMGWFQATAGLLGLGMVVLAVHGWSTRSHRLQLEALERKHALESERTRISSDLHDDVGSNLGSISLLSREAQRRADHPVAEDLAEIARLAQETSDSMRDIVWFINPNEDTVEKMSLRMKDTAAGLLGGVHFEFESPELAEGVSLSPQFKRQFFLIFKESLHNISKHARASEVSLRLHVKPGRLELEVQDNGVGFQESDAKRGHGLTSMRRRAADQKWRLDIASKPGSGTRIHLSAVLE